MVAVVVLVTLVVAAAGGALVVPGVLALAPQRRSLRLRAAALLRGGLTIGLLERLAVAGTILLGHPEGVAIVIAVKGLGRYPEIRGASTPLRDRPTPPADRAVSDREAVEIGAAVSERFIIGTLASLSWAVACGAAGLWWVSHVR